ncbi:MAG: epoxyqueuosine reductase QueH [Bacteroidaceae bacterium]|nr:epoxyqueuosine reductase QueH [Bacteroidaceae bacterium]
MIETIFDNMNDVKEKYLSVVLTLPNGQKAEGANVLLHACCAPCSAAIVECMLHNGMKPTVFFCNPNIYPLEEYAVRKAEIMRFLLRQEVPFVEDVYDHARWRDKMKGLEGEPERGKRCERCFEFRLRRTAEYAVDNGFSLFTTTLASSRWKDLDQINRAGQEAAATVGGVSFWEQNWRRGGLQDRRGELLLENNFYNQLYCGCEFSLRAREEKVRQKSETNPI